jgi:hypothetical protein
LAKFVCGVCGKSHEGYPLDFAWKLPDVVWAIPKDRQAIEAKFTSDLCQYQDRYFIRSILPIGMSSVQYHEHLQIIGDKK